MAQSYTPYLRPNGAYIIRVEDERPEETGTFAELRQAVREEYITRNLAELTKKTMRKLQAQASDLITIHPFAPLVAQRRAESHAWTPSQEQLDLLRLHAPNVDDDGAGSAPQPVKDVALASAADSKATNAFGMFHLLILIAVSAVIGAFGFIVGKAVGVSRA